MLIASAILAFSSLMFVRFAIAYCHSIVASTEREAPSPVTLHMAQLADGNVSGEDFHRIMRVIALCPFDTRDRGSLRLVRMYFLALGTFGAFRLAAPVWSRWIRAERARCARFAITALDRRVRADVTAIT
ncbi:MAG TPA: hypothetical protein VFO34_05315 [Candidatus Acidoferrales bacterium]|nr:hypothetical protein [Candidatus Acidoferrales bacterium]